MSCWTRMLKEQGAAVTKAITEISTAIEEARKAGNLRRMRSLTVELRALIRESGKMYDGVLEVGSRQRVMLKVDEETHGYNKEFEDIGELQRAILKELDENVVEVSIKKRAAKDSSRNYGETTESP